MTDTGLQSSIPRNQMFGLCLEKVDIFQRTAFAYFFGFGNKFKSKIYELHSGSCNRECTERVHGKDETGLWQVMDAGGIALLKGAPTGWARPPVLILPWGGIAKIREASLVRQSHHAEELRVRTVRAGRSDIAARIEPFRRRFFGVDKMVAKPCLLILETDVGVCQSKGLAALR